MVNIFPNNDYIINLFAFPTYCIFIHYLSGFYINTIKKSRVNAFMSTIASTFFISVSVFFVVMIRDVVISNGYFYSSMLVLFSLLFGFTFFFRSVIFSQVQHNFKTKNWAINTLIIGTGVNAVKIAKDMENNAIKNALIGFVAVNKQINVPQEDVLGNMSQIAHIIEKHNIQETIIVLDEGNTDEKQLFQIINSLYQYNVDIQFSPRLYDILIGSAKISNMGIIPLVNVTDSSMSDWETCIKRFLDIVLSFLGLIFISPLLLYFMIRIKSDSKGPIFYRQERIGRLGIPFNILKFRTMYTGSENGTPRLSSVDDDRITPVGRIMRKYRIDEIPQFLNILKGDMSLVGPRPERRYFISKIIQEAPHYCLLYKIRPGLTSWGPIKIGYSDTVEKMIERLNYDIIYLENMSILTDVKILIYTFEIIFKGKGV
jgi:exopolysaccharide biosynthesis polyprenyl glycosylphosphotransferase